MARSPTLRDVARASGVAAITASRVLHGGQDGARVAEATATAVREAAQRLGYRQDARALAIRSGRSGQVGVVVTNRPGTLLTNLPAYEYLLGLNAALDAQGLLLSLVRIGDVGSPSPQRVRAFEQRLFDAFVVIGHLPPTALDALMALAVPVVWLDTERSGPGCIRRDEVHAGRETARLLLAAGRRQLLWCMRTGIDDHYSHRDRLQGMSAACAEAGVPFATLAIPAEFAEIDQAAVRRRIGGPACGLAISDPASLRICQTLLLGWGLVPGRDLGMACCDSDGHINFHWPTLSRVQVDRAGLGAAAAEQIAALLAGGPPPPGRVVRGEVVPGTTA
jgi:DNA-binding LacI/PurR family transcriptional regulator